MMKTADDDDVVYRWESDGDPEYRDVTQSSSRSSPGMLRWGCKISSTIVTSLGNDITSIGHIDGSSSSGRPIFLDQGIVIAGDTAGRLEKNDWTVIDQAWSHVTSKPAVCYLA